MKCAICGLELMGAYVPIKIRQISGAGSMQYEESRDSMEGVHLAHLTRVLLSGTDQ